MSEGQVSNSDHGSPGEIRGFFDGKAKYLAIIIGFAVSAVAMNQKESWQPNSTEAYKKLGEMTFSEGSVKFKGSNTTFHKIRVDLYKSDKPTSEFCGMETETYLRWKKDGKHLDIRLYDHADIQPFDIYCSQHSYIR